MRERHENVKEAKVNHSSTSKDFNKQLQDELLPFPWASWSPHTVMTHNTAV